MVMMMEMSWVLQTVKSSEQTTEMVMELSWVHLSAERMVMQKVLMREKHLE